MQAIETLSTKDSKTPDGGTIETDGKKIALQLSPTT